MSVPFPYCFKQAFVCMRSLGPQSNKLTQLLVAPITLSSILNTFLASSSDAIDPDIQ